MGSKGKGKGWQKTKLGGDIIGAMIGGIMGIGDHKSQLHDYSTYRDESRRSTSLHDAANNRRKGNSSNRRAK